MCLTEVRIRWREHVSYGGQDKMERACVLRRSGEYGESMCPTEVRIIWRELVSYGGQDNMERACVLRRSG